MLCEPRVAPNETTMNADNHMSSDTTTESSRDHPSAAVLAAYADGVASADERRQVEEHLADCAPCREDLDVVRGAMGSRSPRFRWVAGAVATAAAVAVLLLAPAMLDNGTEPVLRGPGGEELPAGAAAPITVVAPEPGSLAPADAPRFVWRSAGLQAQYRLTVTTAAGDAVAAVTTSDTVVTSLDGEELAPATEYFWWVDALRADRAIAETGLQRFRTAP